MNEKVKNNAKNIVQLMEENMVRENRQLLSAYIGGTELYGLKDNNKPIIRGIFLEDAEEILAFPNNYFASSIVLKDEFTDIKIYEMSTVMKNIIRGKIEGWEALYANQCKETHLSFKLREFVSDLKPDLATIAGTAIMDSYTILEKDVVKTPVFFDMLKNLIIAMHFLKTGSLDLSLAHYIEDYKLLTLCDFDKLLNKMESNDNIIPFKYHELIDEITGEIKKDMQDLKISEGLNSGITEFEYLKIRQFIIETRIDKLLSENLISQNPKFDVIE